jgi:hypothetical protein
MCSAAFTDVSISGCSKAISNPDAIATALVLVLSAEHPIIPSGSYAHG